MELEHKNLKEVAKAQGTAAEELLRAQVAALQGMEAAAKRYENAESEATNLQENMEALTMSHVIAEAEAKSLQDKLAAADKRHSNFVGEHMNLTAAAKAQGTEAEEWLRTQIADLREKLETVTKRQETAEAEANSLRETMEAATRAAVLWAAAHRADEAAGPAAAFELQAAGRDDEMTKHLSALVLDDAERTDAASWAAVAKTKAPVMPASAKKPPAALLTAMATKQAADGQAAQRAVMREARFGPLS